MLALARAFAGVFGENAPRKAVRESGPERAAAFASSILENIQKCRKKPFSYDYVENEESRRIKIGCAIREKEKGAEKLMGLRKKSIMYDK